MTATQGLDRSFSRKTNITTGVNTDFNAAEWDEFTLAAVDSAGSSVNERLGYHSIGGEPPAAVTNVKFTASAAAVNEDAGTYQVTVIKTLAAGNVSGQVGLSGTATEGAGADYTVDTTNFTMNGATTSATFAVTINNDTDQETAETIILTLANVDGGTVVTPSVFTLTINISDVPPEGIVEYQFTSPPYLQATSKDTNLTATDMALTAGTIETAIDTGTYFPNEPYVEETGGWTTDNQSAAKAFQFTITPAEGALVTITSITFRAYATAAGPSALGYNIGGLATYAADFPATNLVLVNQPVTGVENQSGALVVQIQGWTNASRVTAGTGAFRLDDVVLYGSVVAGSPQTNVKFTASAAAVDENAGTYQVTVIKTLAEGNVSGEIALSGTATYGGLADYTVDTTNFVMNGATTSATFTVTINDDPDEEVAETIILTLANVAGGTIATPSVFTLTINANDTPPPPPEGIVEFRFNTFPFLPVTSKDANLTVSDMALTAGAIETNITTGTYFPDEPYIEETGGWSSNSQAAAKAFLFTVTPAGGFSVTITSITFRAYATGSGPAAFGYDIGGLATYEVNSLSNGLVEVNQPVTGVENQGGAIVVKIQGWDNGSRPTTGAGAFRLDDVVLYGTVSGAGTPDVKFTAALDSAGEAAGTYVVTAVKTMASGDVSGQVGLSGTAAYGGLADYTVDTTNFTMNGATTSATFTVTINDDAEVELPETVILSLANVVGGNVAAPSVFTLTINDNDGLVLLEPDIERFTTTGAVARVTVTNSQNGVAYKLEWTPAMKRLPETPVWSNATEVTGNGGTIILSDPTPPSGSRFYRIAIY